MHLPNIWNYGLAAGLIIILSACGGSSGSKKTDPTSGTHSSAGISSTAASSSVSVSSVASSTDASASASSSSTGVSVVEDTTLVLPSSLEVVTNEAAH